jgi:hypothetical protein
VSSNPTRIRAGWGNSVGHWEGGHAGRRECGLQRSDLARRGYPTRKGCAPSSVIAARISATSRSR